MNSLVKAEIKLNILQAIPPVFMSFHASEMKTASVKLFYKNSDIT